MKGRAEEKGTLWLLIVSTSSEKNKVWIVFSIIKDIIDFTIGRIRVFLKIWNSLMHIILQTCLLKQCLHISSSFKENIPFAILWYKCQTSIFFHNNNLSVKHVSIWVLFFHESFNICFFPVQNATDLLSLLLSSMSVMVLYTVQQWPLLITYFTFRM